MPHLGPPKFEPLRAYLTAQSAGVTDLTLTFPQIEAILGARLPPGAGTHAWWQGGGAHTGAWRAAGWGAGRRQLGGAAALLGRREEARAHDEAALGQMVVMRFRPEVALCHLDLAVLLADGDDAERAAARGQLATALAELEAMGMAPAL